MTDTNGQHEPAAYADQDDRLIEQLPTAMPGDQPAAHALDPTYEPPAPDVDVDSEQLS